MKSRRPDVFSREEIGDYLDYSNSQNSPEKNPTPSLTDVSRFSRVQSMMDTLGSRRNGNGVQNNGEAYATYPKGDRTFDSETSPANSANGAVQLSLEAEEGTPNEILYSSTSVIPENALYGDPNLVSLTADSAFNPETGVRITLANTGREIDALLARALVAVERVDFDDSATGPVG